MWQRESAKSYGLDLDDARSSARCTVGVGFIADGDARGAPAAAGSTDEFRKLLLADVEELLQQHHASFAEHLDQVATRQSELIQQLATKASCRVPNLAARRSTGQDSAKSSNLLKPIDEDADRGSSSPPHRGSFFSDGTASGTTSQERRTTTRRPFFVRSFTESIRIRQTLAREASIHKMASKKSERPRRRTRLERLVSSKQFEQFFCCLIITNAIFIGLEVQYMATHHLPQPPFGFEAVSLMYTIVFTVELLLRFFAGPVDFFRSHMFRWNLLDLALVVVSLVELALGAASGFKSDGAQELTYVRIIRVARTARIFRVMHALREFSALRILLWCVISTMRSLIWTLLLLTVIMYVFSIMFTQAANTYMLTHSNDTELRRYYGSLWRSGYTLFKAVTGGVSWEDVSTPLGRIHSTMECIFIVFISFIYFAVLNVVTGVFCQSAIESANHDKDMVVQQQVANQQMYKEQLEDVFRSLDSDDSGAVTFSMFEEALLNEDNQLKAYLDSLGILPDDAWNLFRLMDTDESDDIQMEEFVQACLRLRGAARAIDSHMMMYESRWTMRKIIDLQLMLNDIADLIAGQRAPARPTRRIVPTRHSLAVARASLGRQSFHTSSVKSGSSHGEAQGGPRPSPRTSFASSTSVVSQSSVLGGNERLACQSADTELFKIGRVPSGVACAHLRHVATGQQQGGREGDAPRRKRSREGLEGASDHPQEEASQADGKDLVDI